MIFSEIVKTENKRVIHNQAQKIYSIWIFLILLFILPCKLFSYEEVNNILDGDTLKEEKGSPQIETNIINNGFQEFDHNSFNGSYSSIKPDDVDEITLISPDKLLMGKVSGLQFFQGDGAPDSESQILIRGISGAYSFTKPLIVIDGVPMCDADIPGLENQLLFINPGDVKDITVYEDLYATALYGNRAANGLIVINTKRGQSKQPLKIRYGNSFSWGSATDHVDVLTSEEFIELVNKRYADQPEVLELLGDSDTDWQDEIYQKAFGQNHHLTFSGGLKNLPYYVSFGYTNQEGVLKTSQLKRYSSVVQLNPKFLKDHLTFDLQFGFNRIDNQIADTMAIRQAIQFDPTKPVYDPNSPWEGYYYWSSNDYSTLAFPSNPVARLDLTENNTKINNLRSSIQANYKMHFLPALAVHFRYSFRKTSADKEKYVPETAPWEFNIIPGNGLSETQDNDITTNNLDFYLTFNPHFKRLKSRLNIITGFSYQKNLVEYNYLLTDANGNLSSRDKGAYSQTYASFFAILDYSFKNRYLLSASWRWDGDSYFSSKSFGKSWTLSTGWRINNEPFLKNVNWLTDLKLRIGYGVSGIQDEDKIEDAFLRMPKTKGFNGGIDFGFIDNRITGQFDLYHKTTFGALMWINVPNGSTFYNSVVDNIGDVLNKGCEISLDGILISKQSINWKLHVNFAMNKNEVIDIYKNVSPFGGYTTGQIVPGIHNTVQINGEGYPLYSFLLYEQVYDDNGNPIEGLYTDIDGNDATTYLDKKPYQSASPNYIFGVGTSANINNWELSLWGRLYLGNYVYNNTFSNSGYLNGLYRSYSNYLANISTNAAFENPQYFSNYYVSNASFFRLDDARIAYNFRNLLNKKLDIKLYFAGQNLFVISNYEGPDPEVQGGIDYAEYPRPRIFIIGLIANIL